jgi:predicted GNAT family acetyltransferase
MQAIRHEQNGDSGVFLMDQDESQVGELHYHLAGGRMVITHTEVIPRLRGSGKARALVDAAAAWAREHKLKIVPQCWYARIELLRDPSLANLVEQ